MTEAELAKRFRHDIQEPSTRLADPRALLEGAREALRNFKDPHLRASALCVIIYRYLERPELRSNIRPEQVLETARGAARALQAPKTLHDLRWALSLNMARANLLVLLHHDARAVKVLRLNIAMKAQALSLGQPFTNVVKSACALLGIAKFRRLSTVSADDVLELLSGFAGLGAEVSACYRYENHWVYEELSLVYSLLFELAKCKHAQRGVLASDCATLLTAFADKAIPAPFLSALKSPAPLLSDALETSHEVEPDVNN